MQFSLNESKVKIVDVNPRAELHGEDPKPACDIKLTTILPNDVLAEFHPSLKSAFYFFDESKKADLADQGKKVDQSLQVRPLMIRRYNDSALSHGQRCPSCAPPCTVHEAR